MGRNKDLGDFDKDQIVMGRRLGQGISETARLVGCSQSAVLKTNKSAYEDPCPPLEVTTMGTRVLELDLGKVEEGRLVR
ncbi:hypothetical protein DPX16_19991 [Anabarilius grahami]|uniref:Uncharacterized protein n=1 Tax=Anabarilius grahami TaxID=495550 RepID=A0A3N0XQ59_ANAGA|nr:hypothetical protein DPX16_19991 [Anabarilius grahami]